MAARRRWRYLEHDCVYFRRHDDTIGVEQIWDTKRQKWVQYTGGPDRAFKLGWFSGAATKEEAESQHWENGRLVTPQRYGDVAPRGVTTRKPRRK